MRYYLKNKDSILLEFEIVMNPQDRGDIHRHDHMVKIVNINREVFFNTMSGLIHSQSNDVMVPTTPLSDDVNENLSGKKEYLHERESPSHREPLTKDTEEYRSAFKASKKAYSADHVTVLSTNTKKTLVNEELDLFMDPFTGFFDKLKSDIHDARQDFIRYDSYGDKKVDEIYLPYGVTSHSPTLDRWLRQRCIGKETRHHGEALLELVGTANPFAYLRTSYGISLQDTFWVCPVHKELEWDDVNPYRNDFNRMISEIAFTGESSFSVKDDDFSTTVTVEYTTEGMMKKFWRRLVDKTGVHTELVKGSSPSFMGEKSSMMESLMEVYVSQLADYLGIPHVRYRAERILPEHIEKNVRGTDLKEAEEGDIVSVCDLFTSEEIGFVPLRSMYEAEFFKEHPLSDKRTQRILARDFGEDIFADIMVFDALIGNGDRHLGNMGLLVDNESGRILGPAPLFDHGCSLCYRATERDWEDLSSYVDPLSSNRTCWGLEFSEQAKEYVEKRHIPILEKVEHFTFTPLEDTYVSPEKLRRLEALLRQRAERYIGYAKKKKSNKE